MHSLIPAYRELHRHGRFPGTSIAPYVTQIADLVRERGGQTLLDYGCGAGDQYLLKGWHEAWGILPSLYDPAVPEFSVFPRRRFDGVICTDVLEHVPGHELGDVIGDLVCLSRLWCFVSVCCRPAKPNKNLPGGINAHVTIRPQEWWLEKLGAAFKDSPAEVTVAFTP